MITTTTDATPTATLEENRAVATEFFAAVHARDIDRMQAVWKPGTVDAFPGNRTMTVPEEQRTFFLADRRVHRSGEVRRLRPHGRQGHRPGLRPHRDRERQDRPLDAYFDTTEMARAIGLMPPAGSAPDKGMKVMVNLQTRAKRLFKRS